MCVCVCVCVWRGGGGGGGGGGGAYAETDNYHCIVLKICSIHVVGSIVKTLSKYLTINLITSFR